MAGKITNEELHSSIKTGILSELETTDKSNLVAAINEVKNNSSSTASDVSITDTGGYFNGTETESALQEIGQTLNSMRGSLITSANNLLGT